jgi:23S rRNA pseudouridine2605 synthase
VFEMSASERLQRYLARCGVASRRACEELILAGRVAVNGATVTQLGTKVDPDTDRVTVDGAPVRPEERKAYIALNKPRGVLTAVSDGFGRPVVAELVHSVPLRVYPVGRLDKDSEGLLILTNDGELAYRLTHPKYEVIKTYLVSVAGDPGPESLDRLRNGIELEDGVTLPARVVRADALGAAYEADNGLQTQWLVSIHEGRKRQVRRMFEAVGHPVRRLIRIAFGPISLNDPAPGSYRHLSRDEVERLRREVGLDS